MSLLRTKTATTNCSCQNEEPTGVFRLSVEPRATDVREHTDSAGEIHQLQVAEKLQNLFFPNLGKVAVHQHDTGFHAHPSHDTKVAHLDQLHAMMEKNNLIARVQITPSAEHGAAAVALTADHVNELMQKGTVDLSVPFHSNVFRLHSTKPGRITAIEYS